MTERAEQTGPALKPDVHVVKALLDAARAEGIGMTWALGIRIVRAVEDAYNALPVAERMEAMGMEPVAWDNPEWWPAPHVRLMEAPHARAQRLLFGEVQT